MSQDPKVQTLGESERYAIWVSNEPDLEEVIYHIELGNLTLHLFEDEWDEFAEVLLQAIR
jgi:hypothetical protein